MNSLIFARDLWKTFRLSKTISVDVLRGLNISIAESEFISIIGPSGSGKSTMMNMIGSLDVPTKGKILLN